MGGHLVDFEMVVFAGVNICENISKLYPKMASKDNVGLTVNTSNVPKHEPAPKGR